MGKTMKEDLSPAEILYSAAADISDDPRSTACNYIHCNVSGTYYVKTARTSSWTKYEMIVGMDYWLGAIQIAASSGGAAIDDGDVVFCYTNPE